MPRTSARTAPPSFTGTSNVRIVGVPPATRISGTDVREASSIVIVHRRSSRLSAASACPAETHENVTHTAISPRLVFVTGNLPRCLVLTGTSFATSERDEPPLSDLQPIRGFHGGGHDPLHELDLYPVGLG